MQKSSLATEGNPSSPGYSRYQAGQTTPSTPMGNRGPEPRTSSTVQALIGTMEEACSSQVSWSKFEIYTQKEEGCNCESFYGNLKRHTAFKLGAPEHRNLLISASVGNFLPDIKKQIHSSTVIWTGQPLSINKGGIYFENSLQESQTTTTKRS